MRIGAIIVAAGRGSRASSDRNALPKQYALLEGRTLLSRSIAAFAFHPAIAGTVVVIHPDDRESYDVAAAEVPEAVLHEPVNGGPTRQSSVLAGLEALEPSQFDAVLIHDAARPFVSADLISNVAAALLSYPAALAALPLTDTLKRSSAGELVAETIPRDNLWRAQTPQGFHFAPIVAAHRRAAEAGLDQFTDDAAIAEWAGLEVALVTGAAGNTKITTAEDLADASRQSATAGDGTETRTGQGFDVHRFTEGDHVWLGGIKIPHTHRLDGHSDADVVLHALTDALLGTIGDGDIGQHFPPSDPQWKGAASRIFLEDAARRVRDRRGQIINVDVTILAEAPRIGPYRAAMQALLAEALNLTADRIGIKATTSEQLGYVGRREGIAALAVATVRLPAGRIA